MWCLERLLRDGHGLLPGRARRAKARSPAAACTNVLTPDRIPEFCIPPRIEPSLALTALRNSWGGAAEPDDGAHRTDWDPRSQAALSLPHLPRTRTAYGFCALLESPHTRRKESLLLGGPGAPPPAPRPRAHTDGGAAYAPPTPRPAPAASTDAFLAPRPRGRRLLRVADGLLSRALRVRGAPRRARARSVSSGDEDDVRAPDSPDPAPSPSPAEPRPERLQAEGTVALGRAGDALRLAAEYCPRRGRLRIRLLRTEGPGAAALEPRAVGCRLSLVLWPGAPARPPRGLVLARSRKASWERDCCFDGLSEEQLRRLAVRVHVHTESKGRALERRRPLGQGELPLGELLLL